MITNDGTNPFENMVAPLFQPDRPGAAVIVVKNGAVLFRQGYGSANLELGVPVAPQMVFRLGSITKQFTAVCILMLFEQGKLDIQDDLTRFLPEYPTGGRKITIEHLLTHTSGIKSYTDMTQEWLPLWRKDLTLQELIDLFKDQPYEFNPGEKFQYCNSGYILLGAIIEKISGICYAEFVQQHIFTPLGMTHTCYDDTIRIIPGRVAGYSAGTDGPVNAAYLSMTHPHAAGALVSSVDDLALWEAGLVSGSLLKPETLEKAFTPYTLISGKSTGYGFGWMIGNHAGLRIIQHGGGINGFTTGAARIPSENVFAAVLTNFDSPKQDPSMLAAKLAALACGHPILAPTPIELPAESLEAYTGIYAISEKEDRVVSCQEGKLFIQRTGDIKRALIAYALDSFFIEEIDDRFLFIHDDSGKVAGLAIECIFGEPEINPRVEKPLPVARTAVQLTPVQVSRLTGTYELFPGFQLVIKAPENKLTLQVSGNPELEVYAESPVLLFATTVDLVVAFQFDGHGQLEKCVLTQGIQSFPLKKVR